MNIMNITGIDKNILAAYDKIMQTDDTAEQSLPIVEDETEDIKADIIIKFSEDAKEKSRERNLKEELAQMTSMTEMFRQQAEEARKQGEAIAAAAEKQRKCMLIAMRIMCGDKVPIEDQKYLAENNPELYGKAIMMRRVKENPEEHKRISEDEEKAPNVSGSNSNGERQLSGGSISIKGGGTETVQTAQPSSPETAGSASVGVSAET